MKPKVIGAYQQEDLAAECERMLASLLHGLGPWQHSVYLVGGLVPRYLVKDRPPAVPMHAGTRDVDIVVDLLMLADVEAYRTLEENLKDRGFERDENSQHQKVSWRWYRRSEHGHKLILEFLADDPVAGGGKVKELPTEGGVSALNVPHASMVVDFHEVATVTVDLLDGAGRFEASIRHADILSFTCLKALAYADRAERKDAHDLIYCLEHWHGGIDGIARFIVERSGSRHGVALKQATEILRKRFTTTTTDAIVTEGYRKDGPVAVALFELGEEITPGTARKARAAPAAGFRRGRAVDGGDREPRSGPRRRRIAMYVPVKRTFTEFAMEEGGEEDFEHWSRYVRHKDPSGWEELLKLPMAVVLGEARSGKTEEFRQHARRLRAEGKAAFFIRLDELADSTFEDCAGRRVYAGLYALGLKPRRVAGPTQVAAAPG